TTERELPIHTFGRYILKVTNNKGCENSDTINITQECDPHIWVPNAFTPFNEEPNNTFKPVVYDVFTIEMKIYNRWGELVFVTRDINKGWDGTFNGSPCTADMYLWTITYTGFQTNEYIYGTVNLLR
ncbi:MAG: T9SS type B sorting domain-containing protein, partial [Bacteroidia bacterium]